MYNEKIMNIFKNPVNAGSLRGANGVGKVGNARCGDIMKIYLRVNEDGIIEDAKFKTFGCVAAIASTNMAIDLIKGKTIEEALKVTNAQVLELLGGLPPVKVHCSVLAEEAIKAAVDNYYKRKEKNNKNADNYEEDDE